MKRLITLATLLMCSVWLLANPIDEVTAKQYAKNFWKENNILGVRNGKPLKMQASEVKFVNIAPQGGYAEFFIFNNEEGPGFVIISADDCVTPILGYSYENNFSVNDMPANLKDWLDGYAEQISYAVTKRVQATEEIRSEWECLRQGKQMPIKSLTAVAPLVATRWDQNQYYNDKCPSDVNGPGGHAYAGCVACSMAQIMKFWSYPEHGIWSRTYTPGTHPEYGVQTADFANTTYQWNAMPSNHLSGPNNAVATLMYHCGVAVAMNYGPGSSGAYVNGGDPSAEFALKTFFGYRNSLHSVDKEDYNDDEWIQILKDELDAGRPVLYRGRGTGGHAFVCDGYNNDNSFHFNWGWHGQGDGDYFLNNLTPYNCDFTTAQKAVVGIEPKDPNGVDLRLRCNLSCDSEFHYYNGIRVYAEVTNFSGEAFDGYIGAALYVETPSSYQYVGIMDTWDQHTNPLPSGYYLHGDFYSFSSIPYFPGSYVVSLVSSRDAQDWTLVDKNGFQDAHFDFSVIDDLETNSDFTLSTGNCLVIDTEATINVDVLNTGSSTFNGNFALKLWDPYEDVSQIIDVFECNSGLGPNQHYSNGIDFTGTISLEPGLYLMELDYQYSGMDYWECVGGSIHRNPIWVNVVTPSIPEDPYEPNDEVDQAYLLPINFSGNTATKHTTGSNLHNSLDVDYFVINLPSGYDYSIMPRLHDSYNSGNGESYTVDAMFFYSTDGENWSDYYDDEMDEDIFLENGGALYFVVMSWFEGEYGTYLMSFDLERTQNTPTLYSISATASPFNGGTVTGYGNYALGATCTLVASAYQNFKFVDWKENGVQVSTSPTYSFMVNADRNLVATFIYSFDVEELDSQTMALYPNPTTGLVNLKCPKVAFVRVFNVFGTTVLSAEMVGEDIHSLNLADEAPGIYFIEITDENGNRCVRRVVKE